jgi:REP element-mobilizing transposase RayT
MKTSKNSSDELRITQRHLPHWQMKGAFYFITFHSLNKILSDDDIRIVLKHIVNGNGKFYVLIAAVVMTNHVHVMLTPLNDIPLTNIMKGIKGVSARKVNEYHQTTGILWQDESFDRIIRNQNEFDEKLKYMFENPMKAGLCEDTWKYHGWYFNDNWQQELEACKK